MKSDREVAGAVRRPVGASSLISHAVAAELVNKHGMYVLPVVQVHEFMAAIERAVLVALGRL